MRSARGAAVGVGIAVLLTTACSTSPETPDAGSGVGGAATHGAASSGGSSSEPGANAGPSTADPTQALGEFRAPDGASGVGAAQAAECPGVDPAHLIAVFPDARPYEAASREVEDPDAAEGESTLECRLSYEIQLDEDECTFMEVREMTFTPSALNVVSGHAGSLSTTSRTTYFTGAAQRDGVAFQYTLQAGCDEMTDLSDYEAEFRAVWEGNRDSFVEAPVFERP